MSIFNELHADQAGATMVEYGSIVALIAVVLYRGGRAGRHEPFRSIQ